VVVIMPPLSVKSDEIVDLVSFTAKSIREVCENNKL